MSTLTGLPLGIDVGGSGIKGAPVDLAVGDFAAKRKRIDTPQKSTPEAVAEIIADIVEHFDDVRGDSPIGVTLPAIVKGGVVRSAANIDKSWLNVEAEAMLEDKLGHDIVLINDADAAGLGELQFGAARGQEGLVIMTTLGTGIGSALIYDGVLIPNSELGHLEVDGFDAETRAASSVKDEEELSYAEWAGRLQRYYSHVEVLFSPDLIVVGGGVSKDHEQFLPLLDLHAPIVPAQLRNKAGIIGAAYAAAQAQEQRGSLSQDLRGSRRTHQDSTG